MDWFRQSLRNLSKNNKKIMKINVFIDTINSVGNKSFPIEIDEEATLNHLCSIIADQGIYEEQNLYWFADKYFINNKSKLKDFLPLYSNSQGHDLHLIHISQMEALNFNYENFLKLRCTSDKNVEKNNDFQFLNIGSNLSNQESVDYDSYCPTCHMNTEKSEMADLFNCQHGLCRKCFTNSVLDYKNNGFKCPNIDCNIIFSDHEIQKNLDIENYQNFQELILQEKDSEQYLFPKIGWICAACTYFNLPYDKFCMACSQNQPVEYKIPCYWFPTSEEQEIMNKIHESKLENELIIKENLEKLRRLSNEPLIYTFEETECPICMVSYEAGQAIILHSCHHTICKDCIRNYLINIEDAQVKCPTENCIGLLEDREIRSILSEQEYVRYNGLSMRMAEAKETQSFHCKAVNCTSWVAYDGLVYSFTCPLCKNENCIPCNAIHLGMTCMEYKQNINKSADNHLMTPADNLFIQKLIDDGEAMKCPGCGILVQKDKGCDGVTCKSCGIMMCWATKGPRWGPKGKGDTSGGCGCRFFWGKRCHPSCHYCH